MSRILCLVSCVGLSCLLALPAQAQSRDDNRAFRAAFGNCGQRCVINYSPGGEITTFQAAARAVRRGAKRLVVIDGPCISACAVFADLARSRVCITSRARFGFHKSTTLAVYSNRDGTTAHVEFVGRDDPPHSRDITRWVKRNGGFPARGMRMMSAQQAAKFWRRC